jgi:PAS domain S-box-containing protein
MRENPEERIEQILASVELPREQIEKLRSAMFECLQSMQGMELRGARLQAVLDTTVDGIITIDDRGIIESCNQAVEKLFGYRESEVKGRNVKMLMPSPYREHHDRYLANYIRTGTAKIIGIGREVSGLRKDGTIFPMDLSVSEVRMTGDLYFTGIVRDISDRKRSEQAIVSVGEEVRRVIGQELHDALGQELTGLSLLAKSLENKLSAAGHPLGEEASAIAGLARSATQQTRRLAQGLYPTVLEQHGLVSALRELVEQQSKIHKIECEFEGETEPTLAGMDRQLNLFRITQEAVNNAIKHGRANRIGLYLEENGGQLVLSVVDDGIGLPEDAREQAGMGLLIMEYRAGILGASLEIQRRAEGGTVVSCSMPLKTEPLAQEK